MYSLGVTPSSTVVDPLGAGTDQFNSSLLKKRLARLRLRFAHRGRDGRVFGMIR